MHRRRKGRPLRRGVLCGWALLSLALLFGAMTSSLAWAQPSPGIALELVADGFQSPVHLESPQDGTGRRMVVDRVGVIYILTADGHVAPEPFLDVRNRLVRLSPNYDERGLLGFAFHPRFADNGRVYVHYSAPLRPGAPRGWNHTGRVSEFVVMEDAPNKVDPDSERILLEIDQPQANHNGGALAFGPDGYLYIGLGDGGGGNDVGVGHPPLGNGQDVSTLLGSVLRIDVDGRSDDGGLPYRIPPDNPFAQGGGRAEIYAWGFRNPYRFSFDRGGAGHLFVADVGQNLWEEVNVVTGPGNFGWRIKEGPFWFDPSAPNAIFVSGRTTGPRGEPLIDPVIFYRQPRVPAAQVAAALAALSKDEETVDVPPAFGISVIGGYIYRGAALPQLYGRYVFGDWSTSFAIGDGKLLAATPTASHTSPEGAPSTGDGPTPWAVELMLEVGHFVLGFGQDDEGELYVLTTDETGPFGHTGKVYKIVPVPKRSHN